MGPWWGVHAGRWPQRGGPPAAASPPRQLTFSLHRAGVLEHVCGAGHAGADLIFSLESVPGWLGIYRPNPQEIDPQRKIKQASDTSPENMGQTRDFSCLCGAPTAGRLVLKKKGRLGWRSVCVLLIFVPVGICRTSMHMHVRAHLLHTAHLHVLHWHMHL